MAAISFVCEKCNAALKVRKVFAGKTVQCPKCGKKTAVPVADTSLSAPAPLAESAPPSPPQISPTTVQDMPEEQTTTAPPALPASVPVLPPETPPEKETDAAIPQKNIPDTNDPPAATPPAMQQRATATDAALQEETAKLRGELGALKSELSTALNAAETLKVQLTAAEAAAKSKNAETQDEALKLEMAEGLRSAQQRIRTLESQLVAAKEDADRARAAAAKGDAIPLASATAVADDDEEEELHPEALLEGMRSISFAKVLRAAVLVHIIVILVTTGIASLLSDKTQEKPDEEPAVTVQETPDASVETEEHVPREPPRTREPAPPPITIPEQTGAQQATDRPKTELERRVESLPDPGERPTESSVSLDGFL